MLPLKQVSRSIYLESTRESSIASNGSLLSTCNSSSRLKTPRRRAQTIFEFD
jgi:hypothetical protein